MKLTVSVTCHQFIYSFCRKEIIESNYNQYVGLFIFESYNLQKKKFLAQRDYTKVTVKIVVIVKTINIEK
ncbi:Uncharacterised protein [Chryseobacterium gleum]|jgi:hypothetical protein|uniref:Uncharacterized protein n=2 Tax=Chryseobacterium TaxID=59732 RepID=A0A3S4PDG4_CHRGE|nr:hypothetical protein CEQ15_23095 [Chryseobacterium indologenes]AZB32300.1 hypothetical protein EG351_00700 [Chryseobacterium bernardetii]PZU89788.1 MAG: hypothetical protein DI529_03750 [Chryseobacterium sp.]SMP22122.1 hypothetical protein SAMN06264346_106136 [Chryseobacterium profundimaris]VEE05981.1 Uncharacterised protein [Chryseobacterium gleum]